MLSPVVETSRFTIPTSPARSLEGPTRVLLAEDDARLRAVLAEALRAEGYDVHEVGGGGELFEWLHDAYAQGSHEPPPDLVVSDVRMPGLSGLEVLDWVRERDWALPVILVTAFGDAQTHTEAERLGATMVLDKPFPTRELVHAALTLAEPR